jgi:hypothetical protein
VNDDSRRNYDDDKYNETDATSNGKDNQGWTDGRSSCANGNDVIQARARELKRDRDPDQDKDKDKDWDRIKDKDKD